MLGVFCKHLCVFTHVRAVIQTSSLSARARACLCDRAWLCKVVPSAKCGTLAAWDAATADSQGLILVAAPTELLRGGGDSDPAAVIPLELLTVVLGVADAT